MLTFTVIFLKYSISSVSTAQKFNKLKNLCTEDLFHLIYTREKINCLIFINIFLQLIKDFIYHQTNYLYYTEGSSILLFHFKIDS